MPTRVKSGGAGVTAVAFWLCVAAGLFGPIAVLPSSVQAASPSNATIALRVGASKIITLSENPSTGFRWRLDAKESFNPAIVELIDAGFEDGHTGVPGQPRLHRFQIVAQASGTARLVLTYARSWEHRPPAGTYTIDVRVTHGK